MSLTQLIECALFCCSMYSIPFESTNNKTAWHKNTEKISTKWNTAELLLKEWKKKFEFDVSSFSLSLIAAKTTWSKCYLYRWKENDYFKKKTKKPYTFIVRRALIVPECQCLRFSADVRMVFHIFKQSRSARTGNRSNNFFFLLAVFLSSSFDGLFVLLSLPDQMMFNLFEIFRWNIVKFSDIWFYYYRPHQNTHTHIPFELNDSSSNN